MHFIVFYDMKFKHFSNALRYSSLYVISSICQPVAQELNKIRVLYTRKLCRPASRVGVQSKVATRLRLNVCWCTSEVCKYSTNTQS